MTTSCAYKNCYSRKTPGAFLSFFKLPNDWRKFLWLKHIGNENNNPLVQSIFLCEKHFYEQDIVVYGVKKNLKKSALPIQIKNVCQCSLYHIDENCETLKTEAFKNLSTRPKKPEKRKGN